MIQIKNRYDGTIIFTSEESKTLGEAVSSADLSSADLSSIKNAKFQILSRQIVPQEGEFIGFKKLNGGVICKLKIMDGAKRIGGVFGRKCRAEFALVLEGEGTSIHDSSFVYKVGEIVTPKPAFEDSQNECAPGIHFYLSKEEAENHS